MDQSTQALALIVAAVIGIIAAIAILRSQRRMAEKEAQTSPFATAWRSNAASASMTVVDMESPWNLSLDVGIAAEAARRHTRSGWREPARPFPRNRASASLSVQRAEHC